MKKEWIALALALTMVTPLVACGRREPAGSAGSGPVSGSAGQSAANDAADNAPGTNSGTGSAGGSSSGLMDNGTVSREAGRTSRSAGTRPYNGYTAQRRTAYDYLQDSRYSASRDGQVNGQADPKARDFTQGARDLIRDAGDAMGDLGRTIGDAVGSTNGSINNGRGTAKP